MVVFSQDGCAFHIKSGAKLRMKPSHLTVSCPYLSLNYTVHYILLVFGTASYSCLSSPHSKSNYLLKKEDDHNIESCCFYFKAPIFNLIVGPSWNYY